MRSLFILAACVLFPGCARIAFTSPVGKPAPASETDEFKGVWTGERGALCHFDRDPGSNNLIAKSGDEGKEESRTVIVTTVGKDVLIAWTLEKDLGAYCPFRISHGGDSAGFALLLPSADEVKRLVDAGKLAGTYDKEKDAWIISKGDWQALLERSEFWNLENCAPFIRNDAAKKPVSAPEAARRRRGSSRVIPSRRSS